jgi:hypothetical protein
VDEKGPEIGRIPKKDERVKEWHGAMRCAGSKGKEKEARKREKDGKRWRVQGTLPCNSTLQ